MKEENKANQTPENGEDRAARSSGLELNGGGKEARVIPREQDNLDLNEQQAHVLESVFEFIDTEVQRKDRDAARLTATQVMIEAARGENADEAMLWKRLGDLRRDHPAVLHRVLDSLNATGTGFHENVRRMAERMSEEVYNPDPKDDTF